MVELSKFERRVIILVLAALFVAVFVRWKQAESSRVELKVLAEGAAGVQR